MTSLCLKHGKYRILSSIILSDKHTSNISAILQYFENKDSILKIEVKKLSAVWIY